MRRLMSMVQSKRFDPLPLITHSFNLDQIVEAYDVFGSRRAGWGAFLGGLVGAAVGIPVPIIGSVLGSFAGSFLGALAAEYSTTRHSGLAGRVAWGALMGRIFATAMKMALGVIVAVVIIASAWR